MRHLQILSLLFLFTSLSACASKPKLVNEFGTGYERITVARTPTEGGEEKIMQTEASVEIKRSNKYTTAIWQYQTKSGKQKAAMEEIESVYRKMNGQIDGLVAAAVHKSSDDKMIVVYAQFENRSSFEGWKSHEAYARIKTAIKNLINKEELDTFEVVYAQM